MGFNKAKWISITVAAMVFGCHNSEETPRIIKHYGYLEAPDSTYNEFRDSLIVEAKILRDGVLELPAISDFDNIARLRYKGGWGMFDYICTLNLNEGTRTLQVVKQFTDWPLDTHPNYSITEKQLSKEAFNYIIGLLASYEIGEWPFNLLPDYEIMDGPRYDLVIKENGVYKAITWQDYERSESNSEQRDMGRKVLIELLKLADCHFEPYAILTEENDSVSMMAGIKETEIIDSMKVRYKGRDIKRDLMGYHKLKIPKREKDSIQFFLEIRGYYGDGEKCKLLPVLTKVDLD